MNINYLERFQQVVVFLVVREILKKYNSFDEYKNSPNSDKAYKLHCAISPDGLAKLSKFNNTKNFEKFLTDSTSLFIYHRHCHKHYKSDKKFSRNSWFEINDNIVKSAFENPKKWNTKNKKLLSEYSHKWIDKHIYFSIDNSTIDDKLINTIKDELMTKKEKELINQKYENGEGAFISAEEEIKQLEKAERKKLRATERRIKRIAQKTLIEEQTKIAKLEQENKQLKAEIEHLKSLKDLNSDIEDISPIEYEDLDKYFPDGIDLADASQKHLIDRISEKCWNKLNEECNCEKNDNNKQEVETQIKQTIEHNDTNFDIPSEEEILAEKKKTLSYRLQEFHNKGYLQASEAKRLRRHSIYAEEIAPIKDSGISLTDCNKHIEQRIKILNNIIKHPTEWNVDINDKNNELGRWYSVTKKATTLALKNF